MIDRKNTYRGVVLSIAIASALVVMAGGISAITVGPTQDLLVDAGLMVKGSSHPAILVNNNTDLMEQATANDWPGNGTLGNPFVIENRVIDAGGTGSAVLINNTDAYLVIRNCTVMNGAGRGHAGILLVNCTNVNVMENNASRNSMVGIRIEGSSITVEGNDASRNGWVGIHLTGSNITVSENTVLYNNHDGILIGGNHNIVSENDILHNGGTGIHLIGSSNTTVSGNDASRNGWDGIHVTGSTITVSENTVIYNNHDGILIGGNNNIVSENDILHNGGTGIHLIGSSNTTVSGNDASHNGDTGIRLAGSTDILITGNTLWYNTRGCVWFFGACFFNVWFVDGMGANIVLRDNDCREWWTWPLLGVILLAATVSSSYMAIRVARLRRARREDGNEAVHLNATAGAGPGNGGLVAMSATRTCNELGSRFRSSGKALVLLFVPFVNVAAAIWFVDLYLKTIATSRKLAGETGDRSLERFASTLIAIFLIGMLNVPFVGISSFYRFYPPYNMAPFFGYLPASPHALPTALLPIAFTSLVTIFVTGILWVIAWKLLRTFLLSSSTGAPLVNAKKGTSDLMTAPILFMLGTITGLTFTPYELLVLAAAAIFALLGYFTTGSALLSVSNPGAPTGTT